MRSKCLFWPHFCSISLKSPWRKTWRSSEIWSSSTAWRRTNCTWKMPWNRNRCTKKQSRSSKRPWLRFSIRSSVTRPSERSTRTPSCKGSIKSWWTQIRLWRYNSVSKSNTETRDKLSHRHLKSWLRRRPSAKRCCRKACSKKWSMSSSRSYSSKWTHSMLSSRLALKSQRRRWSKGLSVRSKACMARSRIWRSTSKRCIIIRSRTTRSLRKLPQMLPLELVPLVKYLHLLRLLLLLSSQKMSFTCSARKTLWRSVRSKNEWKRFSVRSTASYWN